MPLLYAKNFLTQVIARVDYQPILSLDTDKPSKFQDLVRDEYPRLAELQGVGIEIPKSGGRPVSVEKLPVVWKLEDKERINKVDLSSKYFSLVTTKYVRFSEFYERLTSVWKSFVESYKPSIITRIGLRYINEIKLEGNPFEWKHLLNENLHSSLNIFPDSQGSIARSMHQLHLTEDDYKVIFQFGIFNSGFPNTIAQKEFILDYDCISEDEHEPQDVLGKFSGFNEIVGKLFEQSISDGLREILKKGAEQ